MDQMRNRATVFILRFGFAALLLAVVAFAGRPTSLAQALAALAMAVLYGHAVAALGWRDATVFALICMGVTFGTENIGMLSGVPFGDYEFKVGAGLPHVGVIPVIVGPLYFGMGYASWVIATLVLDSRAADPSPPLVRATAAAFVLVQWDLVMDPREFDAGRGLGLASGGRAVRRSAVQLPRLVSDSFPDVLVDGAIPKMAA